MVEKRSNEMNFAEQSEGVSGQGPCVARSGKEDD